MVEQIKQTSHEFSSGLKSGMPIILGYLPVSFAFGVMAASENISPWIAVFISLSNFTSAGQFYGTNLIASNGGYIEIGLGTLIINIRYMMMSLSLTQRITQGMPLLRRLLLAFGITDEIFTVASLQKEEVTFNYMMGLILGPYMGWTLGTVFGAFSASLLTEGLQNSMGIALYAMFIALILPEIRRSKAVAAVAAIAVLCSCAFKWLPFINSLSNGYVIIICTFIASGFGAYFFPREDEQQ